MTKRKPATSADNVEALLDEAERGRTRVRGFAPWQPRDKSLKLFEQVQAVLDEYAEQLPITVQQIYYRLIGVHGYDKDANARERLSNMINRARRGRMIPMSAIRDDGGVKSYPPSWRDALHFMESVRYRAAHLQLYREEGNPFLFVGARNEALCDAAMSATLHRLGCNATVDGFCSSFNRWAHEQTAHSNHVIEMALAHAVGSDVEKVYRRTDLFNKRRKLMEQWAAYCCSPPAMAGKPVVPWRLHDLRRTAASGMAALGVHLPVIERILNHVSGSFGGIAGVYQRHEFAAEMTEALARWAVHVQGLVAERPGNVVEIRRRGDG